MTLNIQFHSTLLLLHILHVFASLSEYNNGFNLGVASRPMLRFVQPVQDSVVLSGQVTVNLVVHPPAFNLTELGVFFCIELIYRHGHERSCYLDTPLPWTAKIDGYKQVECKY